MSDDEVVETFWVLAADGSGKRREVQAIQQQAFSRSLSGMRQVPPTHWFLDDESIARSKDGQHFTDTAGIAYTRE